MVGISVHGWWAIQSANGMENFTGEPQISLFVAFQNPCRSLSISCLELLTYLTYFWVSSREEAGELNIQYINIHLMSLFLEVCSVPLAQLFQELLVKWHPMFFSWEDKLVGFCWAHLVVWGVYMYVCVCLQGEKG